MEEVYTLSQIKRAWIQYTTKKVMRVLREGKWHTQAADASVKGATNAKLMTADKFMSFPTYLDKYYG